MLAMGQLDVSQRMATVVVPVALYFLALGLLNSRRCPQLLRGRRDFALLIVALCPLFVCPALGWVQSTAAALGLLALAGASAFALLANLRLQTAVDHILTIHNLIFHSNKKLLPRGGICGTVVGRNPVGQRQRDKGLWQKHLRIRSWKSIWWMAS